MKKKGFTLVELLAVIVILAVISLIAIPMILGVIETARKSAFKITCNEIYKSYEQYEISEEIIENSDVCSIFDFGSNRKETEFIDDIKYEPISKLNLKGEMPKNGTYKICENKKELIIDNGSYTCIKDKDRNEILDGNVVDNDITNPILKNISLSSTTNSIRVVVDAIEEDGLITKYYYKINGEEIVSDSEIKIFNELDKKTEYTIEVYVENKSGLKSNVIEKKISTKDINNPRFEVSQSPEETEYATSKKVTILYDNQNGLNYYFKSDVEATVTSGVVVSVCGTDTEPKNCTSSSVTTIEANTWYETTSTTPSVIYTSNGTLYALTSDGKNVSGTSTYTVSKIDTSKPSASISVGSIKTDRVTITATCSDIESGITKYEYSKDNGSTWVDKGTTSSHTFTGLTKETEYIYQIRCTNGSGLTETSSSKESTLGFTNPTIEQTSQNPTETTYAQSRVIKITYSSTNIENPKYYFKSSVSATVSSGVVTASCGTDTEPKNCTSSSVTTLEADTWYETTSTTPSVIYTSNGTLYALTSDGKNVSGTSSYTVSKIDTSKPTTPTITYNGGSNTCSWKNNYNLTLTSSVTSGINHYEIDVNSDGVVDGTTGSNFIPQDGYNSHNTRFRAVSNSGVVSEWTEEQHIHMDTSAPGATTITYNGGSNTCSWKNNYNLTLSSSDNIGIAYYEIDVDNNGTADGTTGSSFIPVDGWSTCTARFRAVDHAGNRGSWTEAQHIHMDTSAPGATTITYNGGSNTCSWKNNYNLTLSSSDNIEIAYYEIDVDNNGTADGTTGSSFIPVDGWSTCTARFRAVDHAGNRGSWTETQHIHMDTSAPTHTNWWWGEVTKDVARLYIQATDNIGIQRVQCPTSTASGGYGNWVWFDAAWDSSANAYRCDITPGTFGHYSQTYATHLYIYDHAGNGGYYNQTSVAIPAAIITSRLKYVGVFGPSPTGYMEYTIYKYRLDTGALISTFNGNYANSYNDGIFAATYQAHCRYRYTVMGLVSGEISSVTNDGLSTNRCSEYGGPYNSFCPYTLEETTHTITFITTNAYEV